MKFISVKRKITTGDTRGSSPDLNSLEQQAKQSRVLFTISIIVWCVMGGLSRRRDRDTCGGCHGHGSHVISLMLSQTSHMISLLSGEVQDQWIRLLVTRGVTSHNPCKYCHTAEEREWVQWDSSSRKNWKLFEKENRSHDVTVLIKGSLE